MSAAQQIVGSDTREDAEQLLRRLYGWLVANYGQERANRALPGLEVIEARASAPGAGRARYTLSSGAVADVRPSFGRDLREAARLVDAAGTAEPIAYEWAVIAVRMLIDGRPVTIEQVEAMGDGDVAELMAISRGKVTPDADRSEGSA